MSSAGVDASTPINFKTCQNADASALVHSLICTHFARVERLKFKLDTFEVRTQNPPTPLLLPPLPTTRDMLLKRILLAFVSAGVAVTTALALPTGIGDERASGAVAAVARADSPAYVHVELLVSVAAICS